MGKKYKWMIRKMSFCLILILFTGNLCACGKTGQSDPKEIADAVPPKIILGDENAKGVQSAADSKEAMSGAADAELAQEQSAPNIETKNASENQISSNGVSENTISENTVSGEAVTIGWGGRDSILVIGAAPKDAKLLESTTDHSGGYVEKLSCEEGKLFVIIKKVQKVTGAVSGNEVLKAYSKEEKWKDITVAEDDTELEEQLKYPVRRYQYSTGEGEETNLHDMIYIDAKEYGFILDCYTEMDLYKEYEDLMEIFISTSQIMQ